MDYHCKHCGFDFFLEEGYNASEDSIICPMCGSREVANGV